MSFRTQFGTLRSFRIVVQTNGQSVLEFSAAHVYLTGHPKASKQATILKLRFKQSGCKKVARLIIP
jgi:hypothetical protein